MNMIPEELLREFADALRAVSETKTPPAPFDWEKDGIPSDVGRLLSAVGGWDCGDFRFQELAELEDWRRHWNQLVANFETGASKGYNHAFWNPAFYPLGAWSCEQYAFDPVGFFGGRPGQVVCFDFKGGEQWRIFPSMETWLHAMKAGLAGAPDKDVLWGACDWAEERGELRVVALPETLDERRSTARFSLAQVAHQPPKEKVPLDLDLLALYAMSRGHAPRRVLAEMADTDAELRERFQEIELDDVNELGRAWLKPLFEKHKRTKGVSKLLFGVGSTRASDGVELWMAPSTGDTRASAVQRSEGAANRALTPNLTRLHEAVGRTGWAFLYAYVALLVRGVLDACAAELPWDTELDVLHRVDPPQLGRCDRDGFVPTPFAIARKQAQEAREKYVAFLKERNGPAPGPASDYLPADAASATRTLRHPDGRGWEVTVEGGKIHVAMIASDGERDTFSRPVKTGWEAETLIAAQLRAGFVHT